MEFRRSSKEYEATTKEKGEGYFHLAHLDVHGQIAKDCTYLTFAIEEFLRRDLVSESQHKVWSLLMIMASIVLSPMHVTRWVHVPS